MSRRNAFIAVCVALLLMFFAGLGAGYQLSKHEGFTARQWAEEAQKKTELAEDWYFDEQDMEKEYFDLKDCLSEAITKVAREKCLR